MNGDRQRHNFKSNYLDIFVSVSVRICSTPNGMKQNVEVEFGRVGPNVGADSMILDRCWRWWAADEVWSDDDDDGPTKLINI